MHAHRPSPFTTRFHLSPPGPTRFPPADPKWPADTTGSTVGIHLQQPAHRQTTSWRTS